MSLQALHQRGAPILLSRDTYCRGSGCHVGEVPHHTRRSGQGQTPPSNLRAPPSDELLESIRAAVAAGIHTVGHTLTLTFSSHPNVLGCGPWEETGVWFFPQYGDV